MVTHDATTHAAAGAGVPVWQRMGLGAMAAQVPAALVDQVLADIGRIQRRVRLLPSRVVVWFVLGSTLFHGQGYRSVWRDLTLRVPTMLSALVTARLSDEIFVLVGFQRVADRWQ